MFTPDLGKDQVVDTYFFSFRWGGSTANLAEPILHSDRALAHEMYQQQKWRQVFTTKSPCDFWVVVSNIFYFYPYLGKWSNLTNIFQMGWNHQLDFF